MSFPEKDDYVKYRLEKSEECFDVAKLLVESQKWNAAVNRLYYSIFYATNALLVKSGLEAKTHAGVKTQLFLNFVKTGRIPIELGKVYSDLFDWRHKGDYADFFDFTEEDVSAMVEPSKELIKAIRREINKSENP